MAKSGKKLVKWQNVTNVAKVANMAKVAKSVKKWQKWPKVAKTGKECGREWQKDEKWQKVVIV